MNASATDLLEAKRCDTSSLHNKTTIIKSIRPCNLRVCNTLLVVVLVAPSVLLKAVELENRPVFGLYLHFGHVGSVRANVQIGE